MDSMALNNTSQGLMGAENAMLQRLSGMAGGGTGGTAPAGGATFADILTAAGNAAEAAAGGSTDSGGGLSAGAARLPVVDKSSKLYEQCEALETFFLKNLITGMRKTVEKSDLNKGGFAGEIYEDMLYDEYAKNFSRNADFGLAELAYLELTGQRGKVLSR
ncbi:MAG: rod-binding protein [Spirochaetaceae bacterium]|jgi:flagellar protein FlgJ|nr:rod-binding protein [Spirochaetaceae bacterium]